MKLSSVNLVYFSPTHTTRKVLQAIAGAFELPVKEYDWTHDRALDIPTFAADELVIVGVPVYAGRVPAIVEANCKALRGEHSPAVAIGVYGNRHWDDAVLELADYLQEGGFTLCSGAAFVAEHSFGSDIGGGRPDASDLAKALDFGKQVRTKLEAAATAAELVAPVIEGNRPYKERNTAVNEMSPVTDDSCTSCGLCVKECPVGIVDAADPHKITDVSKCLRCNACVKICPTKSKSFTDPFFQKMHTMLATNFSARREPTLFI